MGEPKLNDRAPEVSLVVPTLNEAGCIEQLLESIERQSHLPMEVIIVDGESVDKTREIVESFTHRLPNLQILNNPARRVPNALNVALAAVSGDIWIRIDAHSVVPENYIETIVQKFVDQPELGGVGTPKIAVGQTEWGKTIAAILGSKEAVGNSSYHWADGDRFVDHIPFGAYRVDVIRELGGWDEELPVNQDFEFDYRLNEAGYRLLLTDESHIDWSCRNSLKAFAHQYFRYGQGRASVALKHPSSVSPRHGIPSAVVVALLASPATYLRSRSVAAIPLTLYSSALAYQTLRISQRSKEPVSRLAPACAAMQLCFGAGFLKRLAQPLMGRPTSITESQVGGSSNV